MQYVYVFIRTDIPIADQIVQVSHASLEAGSKFLQTHDSPYVVLIGIKNSEELLDVQDLLNIRNIDYSMFYEPDDNMGYTAICTSPVSRKRKGIFKNFNLWEFSKDH